MDAHLIDLNDDLLAVRVKHRIDRKMRPLGALGLRSIGESSIVEPRAAGHRLVPDFNRYVIRITGLARRPRG